MIIVYLRNVGDVEDDCWVVCAKGDPGAVAFEGFPPAEYWERLGLSVPSQTRESEAT